MPRPATRGQRVMSTESIRGNNSVPTTTTEAQNDDEHEYVAVPREWVESVESRIQELEETVEEQAEEIERAEDSRGHIIGDIVEVEGQIDELETGSIGETPTPEAGNTSTPDDLTPLGEVVNLPEHLADEQLSSNQERARFVAKDIRQYGDMRRGELVVESSDIKKVLSAKEEKSIHWETVGRVVDFLDTMGKEDTTVKNKYGTIVCFDPEAVAKWSRPNHSVVTGERGEV